MPYQLSYGNPFVPGVEAGLFKGARERESFARDVERARLTLAARAQQVDEARAIAEGKHQEWQRQQAEAAFHQSAQQWRQEFKLNRERTEWEKRRAFAAEAAQQGREDRAERREMRLDRREDRKDEEELRKEQNALRGAGGKRVWPGTGKSEKIQDGYYAHVDGRGRMWLVPNEQKAKLDLYRAEAEIRAAGKTEEYSARDKETMRAIRGKMSGLQRTMDRMAVDEANLLKRRDGEVAATFVTADREKVAQRYDAALKELQRKRAAAEAEMAGLEKSYAQVRTRGEGDVLTPATDQKGVAARVTRLQAVGWSAAGAEALRVAVQALASADPADQAKALAIIERLERAAASMR